MTPEETADRFDDRAGYKLIAYGAVGIPLYRLTTVGLCLAKKLFDPIEEFVLRSVMAGIESSNDVAALLGLEAKVVDSCLAELLRMDCVRVRFGPDASSARIEITAKGKELALDHGAIVPAEQTVVFYVDGLTRSPRFYPYKSLHRPKELRDKGIPEIRAFPARAPELDEINIQDVIKVVRLDAGRTESPRQLLRINSIERRDRVFLEAVALAYRAESGGALQVAFAIDGRLSIDHESAFARVGGPQKTNLFRALQERATPPTMVDLLGTDLSQQIERAADPQGNAEKLRGEARAVKARLDEALQGSVGDGRPPSEQTIADVGKQLNEARARLEGLPVRPLAVYEHPPLLKHSLQKAEQRVVVISPWIRRAVVTREFLTMIRRAVDRGVWVFVGYGLGEDDKNEKPRDIEARKDLAKLAADSERFILRRLGNTHAKILIKDRDFFVISSFNWLSFKGDPNQTFREEWGTFVAVPSVVEEYFQRIRSRFTAGVEGG